MTTQPEPSKESLERALKFNGHIECKCAVREGKPPCGFCRDMALEFDAIRAESDNPTDLQAALRKTCEEAAAEISDTPMGSPLTMQTDPRIKQKAREVAQQLDAEAYRAWPTKGFEAMCSTFHVSKAEEIIAAAIQSAVDEEREGCAKIATIPNGCACGRGSLHEGAAYCHLSIAAAIRARAQAKEKS